MPDLASFVVRLFLCTPIAIRAFGHVGKNVAFEKFGKTVCGVLSMSPPNIGLAAVLLV